MLLLTALTAQFTACKSTKYTAAKLPAKQLRWGSGGGFTGKETSYALLENGQIFRFRTLDNSTAEEAATKAKTAAGLFSTAETIGLADVALDKPGNMYYFLELRREGTDAHRVTWGDASPPNQEVQDFYRVLQQLILPKK